MKKWPAKVEQKQEKGKRDLNPSFPRRCSIEEWQNPQSCWSRKEPCTTTPSHLRSFKPQHRWLRSENEEEHAAALETRWDTKQLSEQVIKDCLMRLWVSFQACHPTDYSQQWSETIEQRGQVNVETGPGGGGHFAAGQWCPGCLCFRNWARHSCCFKWAWGNVLKQPGIGGRECGSSEFNYNP